MKYLSYADLSDVKTHTQQLAGVIQITYLETKDGMLQFECRLKIRNEWKFVGQISVQEDEVRAAKFTIAESGFLGTAFKIAWGMYERRDMGMLTDDQIFRYIRQGYSLPIERADANQRARVRRKLDEWFSRPFPASATDGNVDPDDGDLDNQFWRNKNFAGVNSFSR